MAPKIALTALQKLGKKALRPTFNIDTQRWRKPIISPRLGAKLRKEAIRTGQFAPRGLYDPIWDVKEPKATSLRAPKGHKRDRNRELRATKIEEKLKGMDEKIDEYRKTTKARKPDEGIETLLKRLTARIK
ncbi:hypothetical protein TL16_g11293 [Triparma laevis f. inornata]|uniref:Large ribosomal subunit protein mL59 domain-containing protein n=2 Tax=Triparma laevis TaxID=1534972 RepID=A0A9W7KUK2_9STRA|nr:hypothetical protein TL16_g11293 [Triparma laevis f. inornata]GMI11856.1 hypothetical protein TrLO_g13287 [Triparma laevis f. longispina]